MKIYQNLFEKKDTLAVIGLGYVGLPIALEFAKKIKVVGFDINPDRVSMMQNHVDPSNELTSSDFEGCDITFTSNLEDLGNVKFFVVASVLAGTLFGISACARKDIGELSGNQPRLVLEEFFAGKSVAYGIFEDRFGNLRRQFRVNLNGNLDGNRLVLDEEFL